MRFRTVAALAMVGALVGCQTTPQDPYIFVRVDGKRMADDPTYAPKFELDKAQCVGEVQKSATGAPIIYYQGIAGAIDAAIIQNQHQQAYVDILKGCMAGKGYAMVHQSQAPAVSAGFKAHPQTMPVS